MLTGIVLPFCSGSEKRERMRLWRIESEGERERGETRARKKRRVRVIVESNICSRLCSVARRRRGRDCACQEVKRLRVLNQLGHLAISHLSSWSWGKMIFSTVLLALVVFGVHWLMSKPAPRRDQHGNVMDPVGGTRLKNFVGLLMAKIAKVRETKKWNSAKNLEEIERFHHAEPHEVSWTIVPLPYFKLLLTLVWLG